MKKMTQLTLAVLLSASFGKEGKAQVWIEQQCAINCVNTFSNSIVACAKTYPIKPSCVEDAVTALSSSTAPAGISQIFVDPLNCPSTNPKVPTNTSTIDQQCAINCVTDFTKAANPCKGDMTCLAPFLKTLSECMSLKIPAKEPCIPAS